MKNKTFLIVCLIAAVIMGGSAAHAQGPTRTSLQVIYEDIRAGQCSTSDPAVGAITSNTPASALLYERTFRGQPNPVFCLPVTNPDGTQMTFGQFNAVSGRASVNCVKRGSLGVVHVSGLRPFGVYSVWIVLPDPNPGPPIGAGGLGGSDNWFIADENGEGQISQITPEGDLSFFGQVGPCMLDQNAQLHLLYHIDQTTHGGNPGPPQNGVVPGIFFF